MTAPSKTSSGAPRRKTQLLHEWSAKRHEQTAQQMEQLRREKAEAEYDECTFSPEMATSANNPAKVSKMLRRRQRIGQASPPGNRVATTPPVNRARAGPSAAAATPGANGNGKLATPPQPKLPPHANGAAPLAPPAPAVTSSEQSKTAKTTRFAEDEPTVPPPAASGTASRTAPATNEQPQQPEPQPPLPSQEAPAPDVGQLQVLLAAEKQAWVAKLKRENVTLMNVLADVRAAKKKLMAEREAMDQEQRRVMALGIEHQESKLEQALGKLPLAGAADEADADGEELHAIVCKLLFRLRASQQTVLSRVLEAATDLEREHSAARVPDVASLRNKLDTLRDVVHYSNLDQYFDRKWGAPGNSELLHRRVIAMRPADAAVSDGSPGSAAGSGPLPEDMQKSLAMLNAKNAALKNNLRQLRARNAQTKKGNGGGNAGAAAAAESPSFTPRTPVDKGLAPAGGGMGWGAPDHSPRSDSSDAPRPAQWSELSPTWQQAGSQALLNTVKAEVARQPRTEGLTAREIDEVTEFVVFELLDVAAPLLVPLARLELAEMDRNPGSALDAAAVLAKCEPVMKSPAVAVELDPLIVLALTYAQTRPAASIGQGASTASNDGADATSPATTKAPQAGSVRFADAAPVAREDTAEKAEEKLAWAERMSLY